MPLFQLSAGSVRFSNTTFPALSWFCEVLEYHFSSPMREFSALLVPHVEEDQMQSVAVRAA
jgi:hypothetical protein